MVATNLCFCLRFSKFYSLTLLLLELTLDQKRLLTFIVWTTPLYLTSFQSSSCYPLLSTLLCPNFHHPLLFLHDHAAMLHCMLTLLFSRCVLILFNMNSSNGVTLRLRPLFHFWTLSIIVCLLLALRIKMLLPVIQTTSWLRLQLPSSPRFMLLQRPWNSISRKSKYIF